MAGRQTEPRTHHVSKHYQKVKKNKRGGLYCEAPNKKSKFRNCNKISCQVRLNRGRHTLMKTPEIRR